MYNVEREINLHQMEIMLSGPISYSDNWISSRNKFYIQTYSLNDYSKLNFDGILVGIWKKKCDYCVCYIKRNKLGQEFTCSINAHVQFEMSVSKKIKIALNKFRFGAFSLDMI